jgi:nitrogen fixation/metabolism regulation signal transduction histidine kinase
MMQKTRIKNQYILSIAVFVIILAIIFASVFITDQQVTQINNEAQTTTNVEIGASTLSYIANDYFLNEQNIQVTEWQKQFSSMSNELSQLNPSSPQDKALVSTVESDLQGLGAIFNDSVSYVECAPKSGTGTVSPVLQLDSSRLGVQNQALAFDSSVLVKNLNNQANQVKQTNTILIFALLAAFGAYFISVYLLIYRRTLRSIAKLQEGTRIIGSGKLDYSIAQQSNDEIGELSHAFKQMTSNLKNVTTSKEDLEKIVAERTKQLRF